MQITHHQAANPDKDSTLQQQQGWDIAAKIEEIANLKQQVESSGEKSQSKAKTISSLRKEIVDMRPGHDVGIAILRRKQEMHKPKADRDVKVIELGNQVAHCGSALADAIRVGKMKGKEQAEGCTWYLNEYGEKVWHIVGIGQDTPTFMEMLGWYASVKQFHPTTFNQAKVASFMERFRKFRVDFDRFSPVPINNDLRCTAYLEKYLKEDENGKLYYKTLKDDYELLYQDHKSQRN